MDDATADVVLSLQLEDLDRLLETTPEGTDTRDMPDGRVALISYRDELATRLGFIRDRRMGRSIAHAVLRDGTALQEARKQENRAIIDRLTASRIAGVRNIPHPRPIIDLTDGADDNVITEFSTVNSRTLHPDLTGGADDVVITGFAIANPRTLHADWRGNEAGPSRPFKRQRRQQSAATAFPSRSGFASSTEATTDKESLFGVRKTCVACNDEVAYVSAVYAPCGHDYCKDCAKTIFINSAREESLFPPRCCQQTIPLAAVDIYLTKEFIEHFKEKSVEFGTPNRIYCAWPTCSAFIPPSRINSEIAVCEKCEYWVCTLCKGPTHQGRDCPEDTALKDLVETARGAGWQRCYHCNRFVELSLGCNHITCHCRAEFCYICARPWKTCSCPQWDEQRLLDRANQMAAGRPNPQHREANLDEIQEDLRENPACNLHGWLRLIHPGRCEGCNLHFRRFIYQCDLCGIYACAGCRHNRL